MNSYQQLLAFLRDKFDLNLDQCAPEETIDAMKRAVEFKGVNLWVLICAILIASLGLNVNSTAVIIGAMLISPLMGPIMGIGLGLGINDFELIKRSFRHYFFATVVGIITSSLYFLITPLNQPQSELLARTSPMIYDVFIAFFGGMAGVIASSAKEKGNVIPGVAIATALMPPLCTAGFGLATGNLNYFFGALYLYFINTVFISLATVIGTRIMHFPKKEFIDKKREKRVMHSILMIVLVTIIPSIWLTVDIIKDTFFETAANRFINNEFVFDKTNVVSRKIHCQDRAIELFLIGEPLSEETMGLIRTKLSHYGLEETQLVINQGEFENKGQDLVTLKSMLWEDFYKKSDQKIRTQEIEIEQLKSRLVKKMQNSEWGQKLAPEMKVIYPEVTTVGVSEVFISHVDTLVTDTVDVVWLKLDTIMTPQRQEEMKEWLKVRIVTDSLQVVID